MKNKIITVVCLSILSQLSSIAHAQTYGELVQDAQEAYSRQITSLEEKKRYLQGQLEEVMGRAAELKGQIQDIRNQERQAKSDFKARINKIKADGAPPSSK